MFCSWVEGGEGVKIAEREDMAKEERGGRKEGRGEGGPLWRRRIREEMARTRAYKTTGSGGVFLEQLE